MIIITLVLLIIILLLFLFKFRVNYNTKVLHNDIKSGKLGMYVSFFVGEIRMLGYVAGYNNKTQIVVICAYKTYCSVPITDVYLPHF